MNGDDEVITLDRNFVGKLLEELVGQFRRSTIDRIGRQQGFIRRLRKITAFDFLILLVFDSVGSSLLETQASNLPRQVSAAALYYRFTASAVNFLQACLSLVLNTVLSCWQPLNLRALAFCQRLLVVDSTIAVLHRALAKVFPGSGGDGPAASYKLQLVLDVKSGRLESCEMTEGREPDQKYAARVLPIIRPGDLIIQDLGYFNLQVFNAIAAVGAYFLSRLRFGSRIAELPTARVLTTKELFNTAPTDRYVIVGSRGGHQLSCRLICFPVTQEVSAKRRERLREDVRRKSGKQPSQERLQWCDWTVLITNVPATCLPSNLVWMVYRLRWQIELFFRVLKSVLSLEKVRTSNQYRLRCHVLSKLILAALLFRISGSMNVDFWNKFRLEVSFEKLAKRLAHSSPKIAAAFAASVSRSIRCLTEYVLRCTPYSLKNQRRRRKTILEILLLADDSSSSHALTA